MHPNFALRRLVDWVQPNEGEVQAVRDRFGAVRMGQGYCGAINMQ
jgi:hypothetical protein